MRVRRRVSRFVWLKILPEILRWDTCIILHPASVCRGQEWWHHLISSIPTSLLNCRTWLSKLLFVDLHGMRAGSACPGSLPGSHRVAISHVTNCPSRYPQTGRQSADCRQCYLSRVVAVGRVGSPPPPRPPPACSLSKCEVTVRYCDKIKRSQSYSGEFC